MAEDGAPARRARSTSRLHRVYLGFALGFVCLILLLAVLERMGLPRDWIGLILLLATVLVYGGIGFACRTTDAAEYYVAGRGVPALYNGMAIGADWMSAASFIGLAGTLYLSGFGGLAFIMGWTGGYCLMALFLAPYLRKFGQYTIPDFLGARYGGNLPRLIGVVAAILCSFTYVVAQIYGVGLITAYLTDLPFDIGIFVGLGGILVCSFLGGMRAVTWTQVAQCIILLLAYLTPVVWLSLKQTGVPLPQAVYGQQLQKVSEREQALRADPKEQAVQAEFRRRADETARKLQDVPAAMAADRTQAQQRLDELKAARAGALEVLAAERELVRLPATEQQARAAYSAAAQAFEQQAQPLAGMPGHADVYAGDPLGTEAERAAFNDSRLNFMALVFCLMVGTASLPHILIRCCTTPTVREARDSVAWALLFIVLLYFTAPALAVLVKYEVFSNVVGLPFDKLPAWINSWAKVDPQLMSVNDVNKDGIFQLGEMRIGGDIIVLAMPEIAGLPYVITAMVAAGGLAAALSTADGLLLTMASALSHDLYFRMIDPNASTARRVTISKALLLLMALAATGVAAQKPADIMFLVSAAFSFAASAFFPALVLGVFWKRASNLGACLGMVAGLGVTGYYMVMNQPWLRGVIGISQPVDLWFGVQPISAGLFGVPVGFAVIIIVSLLSPGPAASVRAMVEDLRYP